MTKKHKAPLKTGKIVRLGHTSGQAAQTELVEHGYQLLFSAPGWPSKWAKPGSKTALAVQRVATARSQKWNIVEYPDALPT